MNETYLWIGIGAAIVIAVLLWPSSKKKVVAEKPFNGNVENSPPAIDTFADNSSNDTPGNFEAEVRMLIDYGNKTEAIRIVREKLGLDLKDAKELVNKMEQGAPIPAVNEAAAAAPVDDGDNEARQLVTSGRLIEAIKLVREQKGLDLKQAKAYIEK